MTQMLPMALVATVLLAKAVLSSDDHVLLSVYLVFLDKGDRN